MGLRDNLLYTVALHFTCVAIVGIPILVLYYAGKPYRRGFYCDDESIRYPYKENTVSSPLMYFLGMSFPITAILLVESFRLRTNVPEYCPLTHKPLFRWSVPAFIQVLYQIIGVFCLGACISQLATDIAKYSIGRLRPHFIDLCKPFNMDILCKEKYVYVEEFHCAEGSDHRLRDARLSFVSGHSSFSAYTLIFAILYLQLRMTWRSPIIWALRPILQAGFFYLGWYIALSRISDYKHHWSDVLAGSLLGTIVAVLTVSGFSTFYRREAQMAEQDVGKTSLNYKACEVELEGNMNQTGAQTNP